MKPLRFIDSSQKNLREMPATVRHALGLDLMNDITITEGSGNVFLDLGFEAAEAEVMKLRAEVMIRAAQ